MPNIFDEDGREKVRIQLLEGGFKLIKSFGLKKTSISDITREAGIATGTFYSFFKTKEEFVYQIMVHQRNIIKANLAALMSNGKITKESCKIFWKEIYLSNNNVMGYLDSREIALLRARWPEEYWKTTPKDEITTNWILDNIENKNPDCDWKVVANFGKSMGLIAAGKELLYKEELEKTFLIFIDAIIDYIYE